MEDEGLIEHAASMGEKLLQGLRTLSSHPNVGDVRGIGLLAAVELVADRSTKAPFEVAEKVGPRLQKALRERGLITRLKGEIVLLAPPLVTTPEQIDCIIEVVRDSTQEVVGV
jgi:adenosylmethionine-8-amino-7-oxononanoate aminotransferase